MKKVITFVILSIVLICCRKKTEQIDIFEKLKNNTFSLSSKSDTDTLYIEFKDSTYRFFQNNNVERTWRISNFNNSSLLTIEREINDLLIIPIEYIDENNFEGLIISEKDYKIKLNKRKVNWSNDLLYGTWIEEKYIESYLDSIPYPPIPPPIPDGFSKSDFIWTPCYEFTENLVKYKSGFFIHESKIDINNTTEFITMNLELSFGTSEKLWRIKTLNDSIIIINKSIKNEAGLRLIDSIIENIKLIKIQN